MDSALGKWEVIKEETKGMEEYVKAHGMPAEKVERYKNMSYTLEISRDGDTYTAHVNMEGEEPATYTYSLGQPFDYKAFSVITAKLTITVEGDKLKETYKTPDREWTCVREINGDVMTATTTFKDAIMVQKLKRV